MAAPRRLIAGNWKMNLLRAEAAALAKGVADALGGGRGLAAEVAVCPPFTALAAAGQALVASAIALGAQDCHEKPSGAFTGSVAAPMLKDLGCKYVILGHSERRHGLGETDDLVNAKVGAAWSAGLVPILCLGETAAERDADKTLDIVRRQLAGSLPKGDGVLVIAYEPVWAIGTGRVPTEADIAAAHRALRAELVKARPDGAAIPILYGGSAKPDNAKAILGVDEVGGLLVGGASLDAKGFAAMARAAG
ncbi:MAG TPA: triose-phosphate isomerase [Alphaproteobacteria bacterium]|jgi:triosephosphate isomerase